MAENKNNNSGKLEKLALIAESLQTLFDGKATVVFELEQKEYKEVISHFREIDRHHKQFSIDISGTEFHFMLLDEDMS
jgi:flagellar basal body P-ring protein FlgI